MKTKDFLQITDLDREEIIEIFDFTLKLKRDLKKGKHYSFLRKKTLAMIFEKSSTRTRVSFEVGIQQLGGFSLFLSGNDIQIGRGESLQDTAMVLSRYVDAIMIRTFRHENVIALAKNATIPVINGLSDTSHPCQSLTDYYTIYENNRNLPKVKLAYIGDGNNVANSLLLGAPILGINFSIATPKGYGPEKEIAKQAHALAAKTGSRIFITHDIDEAIKGADYLYTDVWTSMGQEKEAQKRKKDFKKYRITRDILKKCAPNCKIMHCLPAHRGEEIDADVIDSEQSIVFDQAENRLHVQKAVMCALIGKK